MKTQTEQSAEIKINELPKKIYLGEHHNEKFYLSAPSWDCDWYWGFGYLGNKDCHYHVKGLMKNCDLFDGFKNHFGESFIIKNDDDLWTLCELFQTFYSLKEYAAIAGRGGSHCANNPCKKYIMNKRESDRINKKVLPAIFLEIYKILAKYK